MNLKEPTRDVMAQLGVCMGFVHIAVCMGYPAALGAVGGTRQIRVHRLAMMCGVQEKLNCLCWVLRCRI